MRARVTAAVALGLLATTAAAEPKTHVFPVPEGAHPHDVAPAPDGTVWYTAQNQGALGILDPRTGAVRQVPLGEGSAPHGVIAGPDGAAWITDGGLNAIVRYDPATGAVKRWPLPANAADANLNTAAFDRDGVLWFTGQAGYYGRLDPKSGAMQVFEAPRAAGRTALPPRPRARSGSSRLPAATSPISTARPASPRSLLLPKRTTAPAASGPTARATSGSACGTSANSRALRRPRASGRPGRCRVTCRAPMPCTSTTTTSSG